MDLPMLLKAILNSVMESRISNWIPSNVNNLCKPHNEYLTVLNIDSTAGNIFLISKDVTYISYSFCAKAYC